MKKIILITTLCLACVSLTFAQEKETRKVGSFKGIKASSGIDVEYIQDEKQEVTLEAKNKNYLDKIETKIEGDILVVSIKKGNSIKMTGTLKVYISSPSLESIEMSGGADFYAKELSSLNSLSVKGSGGSDIDIDYLNAKQNVDISISGGSDCNIKKLKVENCNMSASGGSDANLSFDNVNVLVVSTSGGSDATLKGVVENLIVNASGGSDITIKDLKYNTIQSNSSGSSDIHK